jgi:two-component system, NarL family, invasion response regulator UvrY
LATSRLEDQAAALDQLSPRESEVLRMIVDARSTEEIAAAFHLTPKTVANYHYAIKSKLGVSSDIDWV